VQTLTGLVVSSKLGASVSLAYDTLVAGAPGVGAFVHRVCNFNRILMQ
jgi:hypothetical protein